MKEEIKRRTQQIGLDVIKLTDDLPFKQSTKIVVNQIVRSATSVGCNYRSACRAKSDADFVNKLKIVEEETDETIYWIEIMEKSGIVSKDRVFELKKECNEILSIVVASINTVKKRINKKMI